MYVSSTVMAGGGLIALKSHLTTTLCIYLHISIFRDPSLHGYEVAGRKVQGKRRLFAQRAPQSQVPPSCRDDWYQDGILFICSQTRRRPVRRKKSLEKPCRTILTILSRRSPPFMLVDVESSRDRIVRESSRHRCASSTPVVEFVGTFNGAGECQLLFYWPGTSRR